MRFLLLFFLLVLYNGKHVTPNPTILVAYPAAITGRFATAWREYNISLMLWKKKHEQGIFINGTNYTLEVVLKDCKGIMSLCQNLTSILLNGGFSNGRKPNFVLAPYSSGLTAGIAPLCAQANVYIIF